MADPRYPNIDLPMSRDEKRQMEMFFSPIPGDPDKPYKYADDYLKEARRDLDELLATSYKVKQETKKGLSTSSMRKVKKPKPVKNYLKEYKEKMGPIRNNIPDIHNIELPFGIVGTLAKEAGVGGAYNPLVDHVALPGKTTDLSVLQHELTHGAYNRLGNKPEFSDFLDKLAEIGYRTKSRRDSPMRDIARSIEEPPIDDISRSNYYVQKKQAADRSISNYMPIPERMKKESLWDWSPDEVIATLSMNMPGVFEFDNRIKDVAKGKYIDKNANYNDKAFQLMKYMLANAYKDPTTAAPLAVKTAGDIVNGFAKLPFRSWEDVKKFTRGEYPGYAVRGGDMDRKSRIVKSIKTLPRSFYRNLSDRVINNIMDATENK